MVSLKSLRVRELATHPGRRTAHPCPLLNLTPQSQSQSHSQPTRRLHISPSPPNKTSECPPTIPLLLTSQQQWITPRSRRSGSLKSATSLTSASHISISTPSNTQTSRLFGNPTLSAELRPPLLLSSSPPRPPVTTTQLNS